MAGGEKRSRSWSKRDEYSDNEQSEDEEFCAEIKRRKSAAAIEQEESSSPSRTAAAHTAAAEEGIQATLDSSDQSSSPACPLPVPANSNPALTAATAADVVTRDNTTKRASADNEDDNQPKTTVTEVSMQRTTIRVTLTQESAVVQKWIKTHAGLEDSTCFGLDVEWKPNTTKGEVENKVSLLQISNEMECLLVQMLFLDSIPDALVQFLKDPNKKLGGVGINADTRKLARDHGLVCEGEVELGALAATRLKKPELSKAGLKVLSRLLLGFEISKEKRVVLSNWASPRLDRLQIEYASRDAWVSFAIFQELLNYGDEGSFPCVQF